jgi:hypothetical protein
MTGMSTAGVRESRHRLLWLVLTLASPVFLILAAAAVVFGLKAAHDDAHWTVASRSCPALAGETAAVLIVNAVAIPDGVEVGGLEQQDCLYADGDVDLHVLVHLHRGDVLHSSHGSAVRAFDDNPPVGFRPIGPQGVDGRHFGNSGPGPDQLLLISVVDNAEVRVVYGHPDLVDVAAVRAPLQAVAEQAIANLG